MIPIKIHPLFVVAFALSFFSSGGSVVLSVAFMAIVAFSVLVHEMGHALTGLVFHQKVKISLLPFGGLTERQGRPLKGWQEFLLILMGPIFGFLLYFVASGLWIRFPEGALGRVLKFTADANWYWSLLNLIPLLPLDGGQLVRVVLQGVFGVRGLRGACLFSIALGSLLIVLAVLRQDFLIASILAFFTYDSWRLYSDIGNLTDNDTKVSYQRLLSKGERAFERGDLERCVEIFNEIRGQLHKGVFYNLATFRLAEIASYDGRYSEVYTLLEPIKRQLSIDQLPLFQKAAFNTGHWADALFAGSKIVQVTPTAEISLQNARASGELGDKVAEEGWMKLYRKLCG